MKAPLVLSLIALAGIANAAQLVHNGNFEANPLGSGWLTEGHAAVDDWSAWVTQAPSTRTAWLGGYGEADDRLSQFVNTAGMVRATLTFDLAVERLDDPGFDWMDVTFGGRLLERIDLGTTGAKGWTRERKTYDISALMNGGEQELAFHALTDWVNDGSAFVDNVSIQAEAVPEPTAMAAMAIGIAGLLRARRLKKNHG